MSSDSEKLGYVLMKLREIDRITVDGGIAPLKRNWEIRRVLADRRLREMLDELDEYLREVAEG